MSSNNSNSLKSQLEAKAAKVMVDAVARTVTNMLKGGTQPKSKEETTTPSNKTSSNNSNSLKSQLEAKATKVVVNTVARTVFGSNNTQPQQQQPRSTKSQPEAGTTKAVVGTVARTVTSVFRGSTQTQSKSEKEIEAEMNFKMYELKHRNMMQITEINHKHEIELQKIALEHKKLDIYAEERRRRNGACERGCHQKRI